MTLVPSLLNRFPPSSIFFFFNDTATTEIYTLSLHDALPIYVPRQGHQQRLPAARRDARHRGGVRGLPRPLRSEEHTSELQSRPHLVCRLLLEKKKTGRALLAWNPSLQHHRLQKDHRASYLQG